jgi:hypothetical protein
MDDFDSFKNTAAGSHIDYMHLDRKEKYTFISFCITGK